MGVEIVKNAVIIKTKLGYDGGNIPTFCVFINGDGWGGSIGGYPILVYDKKVEIYSSAALEAMMKICEVVGVENWEDLEGQHCRVKFGGFGKGIHVIGNIIKDKWFDIKSFFEKTQGK